MKKFFLMIMAVCLLFAGGTNMRLYAADELAFSLGFVGDVTRGQTITVPINVSNNPGFSGVGLELTYNANLLEITNVTAPMAAMPLNKHFALSSSGTQWISLVNTVPENWYGNGAVVYVNFYVRPNAAFGPSNINLGFTSSPDGKPANEENIKITNAITVPTSLNIIDNTGPWPNQDIIIPPLRPVERPERRSESPFENDINDDFEPYDYQPPPSDDIDYGDFIGAQNPPAAYEPVYEPVSPQNNDADNTNRDSNFGTVPQTGVPALTGWLITMCGAMLTLPVIGYAYISRKKRLREDNAK